MKLQDFYLHTKGMFSFDNVTASVKRNTYASGKSSLVATGSSYVGYLKQSNPRYEDIPQELIGKSFHFTTIYWADIQESDVLTINGTDYVVRAIAKPTVVKLKFTRVHLTRNDD